jgi:hypothetical protein
MSISFEGPRFISSRCTTDLLRARALLSRTCASSALVLTFFKASVLSSEAL